MDYVREILPVIATLPWYAWVIVGLFFLILVLLFLVWRQGRWLLAVNQRLVHTQDRLVDQLMIISRECMLLGWDKEDQ